MHLTTPVDPLARVARPLGTLNVERFFSTTALLPSRMHHYRAGWNYSARTCGSTARVFRRPSLPVFQRSALGFPSTDVATSPGPILPLEILVSPIPPRFPCDAQELSDLRPRFLGSRFVEEDTVSGKGVIASRDAIKRHKCRKVYTRAVPERSAPQHDSYMLLQCQYS